jgi:predicted DNA-binding transcriptional regulator YafY
MAQREVTTRHHLIMNKLRTAKRVTFEEIADYLSRESEIQDYDFNISQRTFQRDILDIGSIYGIYIKYDFSGKFYYIDEAFEPEFNDRFFESFDIYNALKVNEKVRKYIYLEKRHAKGTEHLYNLLHAIKNRLQISFSYQKYDKEQSEKRDVKPLALKEFKYRWYLVARDKYDDRVKTYALDRMADLEVSKLNFPEDADFDMDAIQKHCFGIIMPLDEKPQKVVLSFEPFQGKYIKSLPLHETQKILIDNEQELRISLNIYLTYDFKMELLSHGDSVKVVEPEWFAEEMRGSYRAALEQY